jgi:DNA invertase Pin-like site-specific DNA recombinase
MGNPNQKGDTVKIGYARVSTQEQHFDLQLDALHRAGCEKIYQEQVSGAKMARPELDRALEQLRAGDTLIVWKLDRLGRSLPHLIDVVTALLAKGVGLKSLHDPIDTTTAQGRFIFNVFASLAEFERDLIRERTQAGLQAARARGRTGGRPKGLSAEAEEKAMAAETLYRERKLSANQIARRLGIAKSTLYSYLRHRGVAIGAYAKKPKQKTMKVELYLTVENNSKFVRGKNKSREDIEWDILRRYQMEKPHKDGHRYILTIPYETDEELDRIIYDEILGEAHRIADLRNGHIEADVISLEDPDRSW